MQWYAPANGRRGSASRRTTPLTGMRFRRLSSTLTKVAQDNALPFEPLMPNATTILAMKDASAGQVIQAANLDALFASLMRTPDYTGQFKKDYKREPKGRHLLTLEADLRPVMAALLADASLELRSRSSRLARPQTDHSSRTSHGPDGTARWITFRSFLVIDSGKCSLWAGNVFMKSNS